MIWPSPGAGDLSIRFGPDVRSQLELPLAPVGPDVVAPPRFKAEPPALASIGSDSSEPSRWDAVRDADAGTHTIDTHEGETSVLPDGRSTLYVGETLRMVASEREPGAGRFENSCEYRLDQDGRRIVIIADGTTVADATTFDWRAAIRVELDGEPFFQRDWHEAIPRDLT